MTPGSADWWRIVTASKVAAILGLSTYESPFSLWQKMAGRVEPDPETRDQARGHLFESQIIRWWLDQHPERGLHRTQITRRLGDWALATLDCLVRVDGDLVIVEAKTTRSWDEWGTPATDEIPEYYKAQVLFQLACTPNAKRVYTAVMGPFFDFREYVVERDDYLAEIPVLVERCKAFFDSLAQDVPPELDNSVATYETLRKLHPEIDPDSECTIPNDLAIMYVEAEINATTWEKAAQGHANEIMALAGTAQTIRNENGIKIAARQVKGEGRPYLARKIKEMPR